MYLKEEVNTVKNTVGFDRTVDLRCLNARIGCSPTYITSQLQLTSAKTCDKTALGKCMFERWNDRLTSFYFRCCSLCKNAADKSDYKLHHRPTGRWGPVSRRLGVVCRFGKRSM
jgi:hypothetical protein